MKISLYCLKIRTLRIILKLWIRKNLLKFLNFIIKYQILKRIKNPLLSKCFLYNERDTNAFDFI